MSIPRKTERNSPRVAGTSLLIALLMVCLGPGRHCRGSEGTDIIDAVLLTCYEHGVLGLISSEQQDAAGETDDGLLAVKKRRHITPKTQPKYSMLPRNDDSFGDTRTFFKGDSPKGFEKVLASTTTESPLLSLKGRGLRVGDIVRLFPAKSGGKNSTPLLMFYCGEQKLPGLSSGDVDELTDEETSNSSQSFFLYPYLTGVEWNTFPPRHHKQLRKYVLTHQKSTPEKSVWDRIKAFFASLFGDDPPAEESLKYVYDKRRDIRWLKTALDDNHCGVFHKDHTWAAEASDNTLRYRFEVWRLKNDCKYTTLKRRFPRYHQQPLTCWWSSYSQVRLYRDYGESGRILPQDKIREFEVNLLRREVTHPTPQTQRSAAWFRTYLLNVQTKQKAAGSNWSSVDPGGRNTWTSINDPDLTSQLVNNTMVGRWHFACLRTRRNAWGLEAVMTADESRQLTPAGLYETLKAELKEDNPVIVRTSRSRFSTADELRWRGHRFALWTPPGTTLTGTTNVGHIIVVIGVRECDGAKFVHFAFNDGHHHYSEMLDFYRVVVQSGPFDAPIHYGRAYRMPNGWNPADGWPEDPQSTDMPRLFRVRKGSP